MAFHVACPITCRRICYCTLGFPRVHSGKDGFSEDVAKIEEFFRDPWLLKVKEDATVQVKVPKVIVAPPPPPAVTGFGDGDAEDAAAAMSAQTKRVALQKRAAAASIVAEDYARKFESGDLEGSTKDIAGNEQGDSNVKVMCRLCFSGENEGSERARKMLSCKSCGKKYHRSCLKAWAQHRDLFHWSSWTCPSCRICEVCRRTGDPNKFMFCKRCDAAYHCYCQHPPHKNVSSGPYLCPKHTKCHSCNSTVPGNGLSVRWFLGYTCCDACGRLFVKGNYCPVCLKVYRDSESTPMVCCDICQRWVHCQCDGISDEKYLQFQVDGNLPYTCPTCRGECYQAKSIEDAVQELWRRRDEADKDLVANLRAAAGLPTQEDIFLISPFSDDEDSNPVVPKHEYGRSLKFSLKGMVEKSPKKSKEYGKKSSSKKSGKNKGYQMSSVGGGSDAHQNFEGLDDALTGGYGPAGTRNGQMPTQRSGDGYSFYSSVAGSEEGMCSVNEAGSVKHRFTDDVKPSNENRVSRIMQMKGNKSRGLSTDENIGSHASMPKITKGPKLVIHLGSRNKSATESPRSDASSQKEQDLTASNGSGDMGHDKADEHIGRHDSAAKFGDGRGHKPIQVDEVKSQKSRGTEGHLIKIKKPNSEAGGTSLRVGGKLSDDNEVGSYPNTPLVGKSTFGSTRAPTTGTGVHNARANKMSSMKSADGGATASGDMNDDNSSIPSHSTHKDPKPLLKLKFKNPYHENQNSWASPGEDEKSSVKGQRSKRKRPSPFVEKTSVKGEEDTPQKYEDNSMDEIMDANWILQKLGKDAIGKRVEVHQPSDNTWNRGTVTEVFEGTTIISVHLDSGKAKNLELGKQGIRFVSQKQRR